MASFQLRGLPGLWNGVVLTQFRECVLTRWIGVDRWLSALRGLNIPWSVHLFVSNLSILVQQGSWSFLDREGLSAKVCGRPFGLGFVILTSSPCFLLPGLPAMSTSRGQWLGRDHCVRGSQVGFHQQRSEENRTPHFNPCKCAKPGAFILQR